MSIITLTTDFGSQDWFVGTMKGVMLGIEPRVRIVDITHEIRPGDIRGGAFALMAAAPYFPNGTIHVAVIDPGVGSQRRALAIRTERSVFIGPDNGVLTWALRNETIKSVREIANEDFFLKPVSQTFHGRDIFAPAAAHLLTGKQFSEIGPVTAAWVHLPWPETRQGKHFITGEIIHIDRFGNAITNLQQEMLGPADWARACVSVKQRKLGPPLSSYASVKPGKLLPILSSSGFLEIAVNGGSARQRLKLNVADWVKVQTSA